MYVLLSPSQRVSDRGRDDAYFARPHGTSSAPANGRFHFDMSRILEPDTLHGLEDNLNRTIGVAQSLYRCRLSCKDAFPPQNLKEEWIAVAWKEACEKTGGCPSSPPLRDEACSVFCRMLHEFTNSQFVVSSITLLTDMKRRVMHHVESFYGFGSSRAPTIISRNTSHAQALLTDMTFIYRVRPTTPPLTAH